MLSGFHLLQDMIKGDHVEGFPHLAKYAHMCSYCVLGE